MYCTVLPPLLHCLPGCSQHSLSANQSRSKHSGKPKSKLNLPFIAPYITHQTDLKQSSHSPPSQARILLSARHKIRTPTLKLCFMSRKIHKKIRSSSDITCVSEAVDCFESQHISFIIWPLCVNTGAPGNLILRACGERGELMFTHSCQLRRKITVAGEIQPAVGIRSPKT